MFRTITHQTCRPPNKCVLRSKACQMTKRSHTHTHTYVCEKYNSNKNQRRCFKTIYKKNYTQVNSHVRSD